MKAVIAGATGLVGSFLVQKLLAAPEISEVISISRRRLDIPNNKLNQILINDLGQISPLADQLQGDIYFCCLGTTIKAAGSQENFRKIDFKAILDFGKVAQASSAASFVVISAMGANAKSSIFYNQVKGETEEALQKLGLKSLTIFRPGLLIGDRMQFRRGEKLAIAAFHFFSSVLPIRTAKMLATSADHLADRMLEAGLNPSTGVTIINSADI